MREYFVISREWQGAASVARQTVKFATVHVLLFVYWDDNDDRYDGDPYPSVLLSSMLRRINALRRVDGVRGKLCLYIMSQVVGR